MFTLSFKPQITLTPQSKDIIVKFPPERIGISQVEVNIIVINPKLGFRVALDCLKQGTKTLAELRQLILENDGKDSAVEFEAYLDKFIYQGWICFSVLPLATAIPLVKEVNFAYELVNWENTTFTLSRFAYLHQVEGKMQLDCPLSKAKIILHDWRSSALIAKLSQPQTALSLRQNLEEISDQTVQDLLRLLLATKMLSIMPQIGEIESEKPPLLYWEFHDLLFHSRTRMGRHDQPSGSTRRFLGKTDEIPAIKPAMSDKIIPLPKPNLDELAYTDITLSKALEIRESIREYDEKPMTLRQLGSLLYRCGRVNKTTEYPGMSKKYHRPYPSGGALYELEIYPVVSRCQDLEAGVYQYLPLEHRLCQISKMNQDVEALLADARKSSGEEDYPQVNLVITARFGRLFWTYQSLAYALILKHVGVLYQSLYLVCVSMNLAPSAIGTGDSDLFAKITGMDYYEESSVGEFILGSLKQYGF
jgi:SagB-type dehydrogenase family enzyme